MPDAGEGHGRRGARHDETLLVGELPPPAREEVRLGAYALGLALEVDPGLVDRDELLVQVVEGGAGGAQPVLERRHVAGMGVAAIEVTHRLDRESRVLPVLLGGERPRAGVLRVVDGAVDEVSPCHDDLVVAGEEPHRLALEVVLGEGLGVGTRRLARPHPDPGQGGQVLAPPGRREVCRPVGLGLRRGLETVREVPVVVGEDLEEVGEEPELRDGVVELLGGETADLAATRRRAGRGGRSRGSCRGAGRQQKAQ